MRARGLIESAAVPAMGASIGALSMSGDATRTKRPTTISSPGEADARPGFPPSAAGGPGPGPRRWAVAVLALLFVGLASGAALRCAATEVDGKLLLPEAGARWIHVERPFSLFTRRDDSLADRAEFRLDFRLPAGSPSAAPELVLRSLGAATVQLDQRVLRADGVEARPSRSAVRIALPPLLEPGWHDLRVHVLNPAGPALILLHSERLGVRTGPGWLARNPGEDWRPALDADELSPAPVSRALPPVSKAVRSLAPWLLAVFIGALVVGIAAERMARPMLRDEQRISRAVSAAIVLAWVALALHNLPKLPMGMGMDYRAHVEYIEHVRSGAGLPLATDGWQMFQPPLYYVVSALALELLLAVTSRESMLVLLYVIPLACGLGLGLLSHRAARAAFPGRIAPQIVAASIGALSPMSLSLCQSIGNEPLAALWFALAIALGVEMLRDPGEATRPSKHVLLGATLGLGLLSKVSVILAVPPLLAFGVVALRRSGARWSTVGAAIVRVGGVCALVSGWYYARNWIALGRPFVGGWEADRGIVWWQDPGYRTPAQYLSFGESLVHPLYAGTHGFWDGLHSTMWLDGMLGGKVGLTFAPWNFEALLAGAWLGLVPAALILVGVGVASLRIARGQLDGLVLAAVSVGVALVALFGITLRVPTYSAIKATYTLGLLPSYGILAAAGFEALGRRPWSRSLLVGALACWGVFAYAAYFARG